MTEVLKGVHMVEHTDPPAQGDFELVLGKRQIASLLFLGIILLGVFSTVAYVVGRRMERATLSAGTTASILVPKDPIRAQIIPAEAIVIAGQVKADTVTTTSGGAGQQAGSRQLYLQIAATDHSHAVEMASAVKKKGYPALVATGPTPDTFRVLVGPFTDSGSLTKTKTELEAAGYISFIRQWDSPRTEPVDGP